MAVLARRYEVVEPLGSGGMGLVLAAYDRLLERPVAIKLIHENYLRDPVSRERFWREAKAAAGLSHPNTVAVYDLGEDAGRPFIVMELVDGSTLAERLDNGRLAMQEVIGFSRGVLAGLGAAHERGIVHRDVKPSNILVSTDGAAKLADFGIAAVVADAETRLTRTGQVVGTPRYQAPECAAGKQATPASDLYSLGVVIYECLAGRAPFEEETPLAMALAHQRYPVPPLTSIAPNVPPALAAVVERALAKDPANRYSDAGAMRRALETLSIAVPTQQVDTAIIEPPESSKGADSVYRRRLLLGWLVWSAALAAAVVWLITK